MTKIGKKAAQDFFCAVIFLKITLFIYKSQTRVWFVYTGQSYGSSVVKLPNQYAFHRKLHRESKAPFGNIHFSHIDIFHPLFWAKLIYNT
jgi:hypothetical protein